MNAVPPSALSRRGGFLVFSSDRTGSNQALRMDLTVQFVDPANHHLDAIPPEDILTYQAIKKPPKIGPSNPLPIPLPKSKKKGPLNTPEIVNRALSVKLVPPGEKVYGFFYFEAEYAPGKTIRAELYLGDGKFGAQMKYADKRGSPCVVIQGGNEKAKGEVQIKDLILGAEIGGMSKDREDYLKKQTAAQFAVAEDKLVDAVREVLARHDVNWS